MLNKLTDYIRINIEKDKQRIYLWIPVLFGIGIGSYFLLADEPSQWITLGILEILIISAILLRHYPKILKILLVFMITAFGFAWMQIRTIYVAREIYSIPQEKLYLQGKIKKIDTNQKGKTRVVLENIYDFDKKPILGSFRITLRNKDKNLQSGQCVELVATLMPRAKAQIPNGFQFDRKNFFLGLSGSGFAESTAYQIDCENKLSWKQQIYNSIQNWRKSIINNIYKTIDDNSASIVAAIVAGEQSEIKTDIKNDYRNSGLAHFLSISGMHMSMIAGLMFFLIRLCIALIPSLALRFDSKKIAVGFAIIISSIYLLISGAEIPAQRAFIMTFIVLLGILFNRQAISMNSIAWAASILMIISPEAIISASFQMSFAAVIALIAFYEKIANKLNQWFNKNKSSIGVTVIKSIIVYIVGIIAADLIASLATLPFAIYHFNKIALYTTLTNLLAGPIIGLLVMPFALFSLILMPFGVETSTLYIIGKGIDWLNNITSWISSLPHASLQILSMPTWGLLLIVLGGLWTCIWTQKWRYWGLIFVILGFASIATVQKPDIVLNEDATLIGLKDNHNNILILPSRGKNFTKQIWLEKTASAKLTKQQYKKLKQIYAGKLYDPKWIDLKCNTDFCNYKNRFVLNKKHLFELDNQLLNIEKTGGMAIYLNNNPKIITVNQSIGKRWWNK